MIEAKKLTIDTSQKFSEMVNALKLTNSDIWWESSREFPSLGRRFCLSEQRQRQKAAKRFIKGIAADIEAFSGMEAEDVLWKDNFRDKIRSFAIDTIGLTHGYMDVFFNEGFINTTNQFVTDARRFDPKLNLEDIFQAIRNVWIMNSIQHMLGLEVHYTPAIFAYSMLYPYTDNILDDPGISLDQKFKINERFGRRLSGELVEPLSMYEEALFRLVCMIEQQYDRKMFPEVFDSLIAIYNGQVKSLFQQSGNVSPYETDILGISIEKGGTSVLADAYLVKGHLTKEETDFMFGFGVILQLADDLQDVGHDLANRHMTIFTNTALYWRIDNICNQLFGFLDKLMERGEALSSLRFNEIREMIVFNMHYLMLGAVGKNGKYFSREYKNRMEKHFPFGFSSIKGLERKIRKEYGRLVGKNDPGSVEKAVFSMLAFSNKVNY